MPSIELRNISNYICQNTDLFVRDGELMVLLGNTGAGKTTLLNVIAGLVPYEGNVFFNSKSVDGMTPREKNVGYLFQDFALFPHLNVHENIAFGLYARGLSTMVVEKRVEGLIETLRINHLVRRYQKDLSGGEKQRVALARALSTYPNVLLLDEPFSNLDLRTSKYLRIELQKIQRKFDVTTIYVTHNQVEAFEMGDRIAIIDKGNVEQIGAPTDIFFSPRNVRVSKLIGSPNILKCNQINPLGFGIAKAELENFSLLVPYEGRPITKIAILPWSLYISRETPPGPAVNRFRGIILKADRYPPVVRVKVDLGGCSMVAELPEELWDETGLNDGDQASVIVPLRWIRTYG